MDSGSGNLVEEGGSFSFYHLLSHVIPGVTNELCNTIVVVEVVVVEVL